VCPGAELVDTDPQHKLGHRDWPICAAFWPSPRCYVYSVGVANQWSFEDNAAANCTVHAYDPTEQLKQAHEAHGHHGVEFHFLGLGGDPGPRSTTTAQLGRRNHYGNHSLTALRTLNELVASNAGQPSPDVLKIDCEGCEWPALLQIARQTPSILNHTSVLFLEVHVAASMVPKGTTSEHASEVFRFLLDDLGFRVWWMRNNPGHSADRKVAQFAREAGVRDGQCCYELALARLPALGLRRRRAVRASRAAN
jgi:hypothetical protein